MKKSGAALVEVIVSTAVFSLLVISTFVVYNYGKYQWKSSVMRNALQWNARKAMALFAQDTRLTNFNSVSDVSNPITIGGITYPRWAICMAGLDDWRLPANFSVLNLQPIWNVYVLYISTSEQGVQGEMGGLSSPTSGRFFRIQLYPAPNPGGPLPNQMPPQWSNLSSMASTIWGLSVQDYRAVLNVALNAAYSVSPGGGVPAAAVTYLGTVDAFSVNRVNMVVGAERVRYIQITYRTKEKATAEEAGQRGGAAYEGLQVDFSVQPQNTP